MYVQSTVDMGRSRVLIFTELTAGTVKLLSVPSGTATRNMETTTAQNCVSVGDFGKRVCTDAAKGGK